jgi:hypothetical protein
LSTITVSNIKKTGETASRDVSGVAAAWVSFNGTGTIAILESMNVSGLLDNGVGDYDVNITNSMATSTYHSSGCSANIGNGSSQSSITVNGYFGSLQNTTSAVQIYSSYTSSGVGRTLIDHDYITAEAKGDLA